MDVFVPDSNGSIGTLTLVQFAMFCSILTARNKLRP